jgi:excisionase family DNA binding protein
MATFPPASPSPVRSLSIDRAALILGVSRRTIYNRIRRGHLQTLRTRGGSQRVLWTSLEQFVLARPPRAHVPETLRLS